MSDNFSKESAKLILGDTDEGDVFYVKFLFFKIKLSIPYLTGTQIIKVSKYASQIEHPNTDSEMFHEMLRTAKNVIINESKMIAAATGSKLPFLYKLIAKGENKHRNILLKMIEERSDPEGFFLSIKLARGLNQLKQKEN